MVMNCCVTLSIFVCIFVSFVHCSEKAFATCYRHFGCVNYTNEWFDNNLRPVNLRPLERYIVNTRFLLLLGTTETKILSYDTITADPTIINITAYNNERPLIMLIHDFTSNGYTGWIKHMAMYILMTNKYNVVSVDWQEGAEPPLDQAISNARIVAIEIGIFLKALIKYFSLIKDQLHLIGHGVGAHIAGYVGKEFRGRLGRITALDPTGPRFEGMSPVVRLHHTDAYYVEVLHTDGVGSYHQGTMQPFGNMDFYFNGGSYQPGCQHHDGDNNIISIQRNDLKSGTVLPDCSHKRAFKYYLDALSNCNCMFLALPQNHNNTKPVNCSKHKNNEVQCATIGLQVDIKYYAKQVNAHFAMNTRDCSPYCLNQYQIQIDFEKCVEAEEEMTGYFIMQLVDKDEHKCPLNITFNKNSNDSQVIRLGEQHTFNAFKFGRALREIRSIQLTWHFTTPFCYLCRNATCISQLKVGLLRPYISSENPTIMYTFQPKNNCSFVVLYDHSPNDNLVLCVND